MLRLVAHTQVYVDKGNRWAPKGGDEYLIATLEANEAVRLGQAGMQRLVEEKMAPVVARSVNDDYVEDLIDWNLYDQGELTPDEQLQMDCEGKIIYPPKVL